MTPPPLRRAAGHLGTALGLAARRLGIGPAVTRAALSVLRRLEPGHPLLTRAAAAERTRALREACADDASRDSLDEFLAHRTRHLTVARTPSGHVIRGHGASEGDAAL